MEKLLTAIERATNVKTVTFDRVKQEATVVYLDELNFEPNTFSIDDGGENLIDFLNNG